MFKIDPKKENEARCFGFGTEMIADPLTKKGAALEVEMGMLKKMQQWPGHLGVSVDYPKLAHIYDTREHAQAAYEMVKEMGFRTGRGVTEVFVEKKYLPEWFKEE